MIPPPIPENDLERLQNLQSYQLLDTLPEADYDEITRIASYLCQTPMALITLVDKDRQFFKSKKGIEMQETHRDYSFCAHAINSPSNPMIVVDARKDERFSENPLVDDSPNLVFYAGVPIISPEGFPLGTLCVLDTSPRKLSDDQLSALQGLARQVINLLVLRRQNSDLRKQKTKLQQLARDMEEFAYAVSHDLKEPLRMVKSFMDLLQKKYRDELDDKARQYIHYAVDGTVRMENMINDLLEYARAGTKITLNEEIDLEQLMAEVCDLHTLTIQETDAVVQYQNLSEIKGSWVGIRQVLTNLVANALKFRRADIAPQIAITCADEPTRWVIGVHDNGIGIPKDFQTNVFDVFRRLHSRDEYAGSGIGLAICKKVVQAHQGDIWVESEEGKGSAFYFTISKKVAAK